MSRVRHVVLAREIQQGFLPTEFPIPAQVGYELFAQVAISDNAELRAKAQTALRNLQPAGGGYKGKGEIKVWDKSLWETKPNGGR